MIMAFAPFRLKDGVTEQQLLTAYEIFEADFANAQTGVVRRALVKNGTDRFLAIMFYEDLAALERIIEAERNSPVAREFFSIIELETDGFPPVYEVLKTYES